MATIREVYEKCDELQRVEQEYLSQIPVCDNRECSFWRSNDQGCCSWSVLLEECKDYEPLN